MAEHLPNPLTNNALMPFAGEMEQFFNRMMRGWPFGWTDSIAQLPGLRAFDLSPKVEVKENGSAYSLTVEVPGLDQNDLKVLVEDDVLTISGEKKVDRTDEKTHYSERSYGSFRRSFTLPLDADRNGISAHFGKGVLTLEIAKSAHALTGTKEIEIRPS